MYPDDLIGRLRERSLPFEQEVSLSEYTTFRTGGKAALLALPRLPQEGDFLFQYALQNKVDFFILGGGSNLLISDKGFNGLIIHPGYPREYHILNETGDSALIKTNASCTTGWFSREMAARGFSGAQFLATIPGTLGGALVQNAGCYGGEMSQAIESALISDSSGMRMMHAAEMKLSYRSSVFKTFTALIHNVTFRLTPGAEPGILEEEIEKNRQMRLQSQPRNRKSAGSVFKNPPGQKAWELIEAAGCKGMKEGGALLSPEHSNFIVNNGDATSSEIWRLMTKIKERVKEHSGIVLEPEIALVGDFS